MNQNLLFLFQSEPALPPDPNVWLTLAEAKAFCRVDIATDDALITALIAAARDFIEDMTSQVLEPETRVFAFDRFDAAIVLPVAPVRSITSITWLDDTGAAQVLAPSAYRLVERNGEWRVYPAIAATWPTATSAEAAVMVTAQVGPASRDALADGLRQAGQMIVANWYENREGVSIGETAADMPFAVKALLASKRLRWIA